ncbi:MAG TPA: ABC transporter permease subunit [Phototrophicaceae bacterium]|nr:ABC transporter permease subunit [Phototrophicaceae bacterium]
MKKFIPAFPPRLRWTLAGIGLLLLGWQLLAMTTHSAIVASPAATLAALHQLGRSGQLGIELVISLKRLLIALALASGLGFGLGLIAGFSRACRALLEPLRWVTMTLPTVFVAILGLLWFGLGDTQVIFLVMVITAPVIYLNTLAGFDTLDQHLIEMGRVYRFPRWQFFTDIYLPGIGFNVITGLTLAAGLGVRAVLMAELLGAADGVGHSFNRAWTFLKTPELFAWMLASLLLMALLEFGLLMPLRRVLMRWQREAG